MSPAPRPPTAFLVAAVAGLAHAAASMYWALGGTFLLDTVGGAAASAVGRSGIPAWLVLVLAGSAKALLAVAPLALHARGWTDRRVVRLGLTVVGVALAAYGLVLTLVGLVALTGALGPVANPTAVRGHALLWDPLFAVWGLALLVGAVGSRRAIGPRSSADSRPEV